ncbi:MAG: VWA domain-containing protein, partial [Verrucomicrobiae bacterium]|nr:VWA domain-containing protein [Verrucomicrobiae bacterium]
MIPKHSYLILYLAAIFLGPSPRMFSSAVDEDRTLAPYFYIPGGDESVDRLPLKSTDVDVKISGVIAEVVLKQEYQNMGSSVIQAEYTFPLSTRAAVHGMTMHIGERILKAKVKEKEEARQVFKKAQEEGKTASLLEQHRPNVFTMKVANILPGDVIEVEVHFTELLIPDQNIYSFVFPTVVGPRYSENSVHSTDPGQIWVQNPYLSEEQPVQSEFNLKVQLDAGMPLKEVTSRTHKIVTNFINERSVLVNLSPDELRAANRDFILEYRLAGDKIQTGLILHEGRKENFFLFIAQPPERVNPEMMPPRDYVFIIDVSGSMSGFPLDTSKEVMKSIFATLRPEDSFNVLLFAAGSEILFDQSVPAASANIQAAWHLIDEARGGGGTRLLPAMKRALALPKSENLSRSLVVLTDGYVDVEMATFDLIREKLGDANLFAFGIGSSVNRFIIEGMSRVGQGESFIVTDIHEAAVKARTFARYISSPVLTHVEVAFRGLSTYDVEPKSFPDLFAERPLIVFGKWRGEPLGEVVLTGINGQGTVTQSVPVISTLRDRDHLALGYLWARQRIAQLSDYYTLESGSEHKAEVTNLGLTYNLATQFTSFIAVDETPRNFTGTLTKVQQPLLQPKGVSNQAFSGVASTPEPRTIFLAVAVALILGY